MTMTTPDNVPMLILNLKQGFTISGTVLKRGRNMQVVLHKNLKDHEAKDEGLNPLQTAPPNTQTNP